MKMLSQVIAIVGDKGLMSIVHALMSIVHALLANAHESLSQTTASACGRILIKSPLPLSFLQLHCAQ